MQDWSIVEGAGYISRSHRAQGAVVAAENFRWFLDVDVSANVSDEKAEEYQ